MAAAKVWRDLDQTELDAQYTSRGTVADFSVFTRQYAEQTLAAKRTLKCVENLSYGDGVDEKLDIYPAAQADAPVMVFFHGGDWRALSKDDSGFAAPAFVAAGVTLVVPDFTLVQDAADSLRSMAEQVRRSIAWVYKNAGKIGGDVNRIYISGHSSGAHLAGTALITDWRREHGIPDDFIKGALLCGGIYDLKGARLSARSNYVKFDDAMEDALSTQRHLDKIRAPVLLVHGTLETPEFQRQTRDFATALKQAGKPVELIVAEGFNHFEIRETFANPFGIVGRALLAQMKLSGNGN